jgi:hypothetical protein
MATVAEKPKVDVHQAVKAAMVFFQESFSVMPLRNVQLEEVDMTEDGKLWLITLGYDDPAVSQIPTPVEVLMRPRPLRKFKVVHVDTTTGSVSAIKNR